jgi:Fur family ferric uptake transcriptional regulator
MAMREALGARGIRLTGRRAQVLDYLAREGRHRSLEELSRELRRRIPGIGRATVFRTVRLLVDMGLAASVTDARGVPRYEAMLGRRHHDHLICLACGNVMEFENPAIERLQSATARRHRFIPAWHRHEIYGRCARCPAPPGARHRGPKDSNRRME